MAIITERDDARRQLTYVLRGEVTADDVIASRVEQANHGLWGYASLLDMSELSTQPEPADLLRVQRFVDALCEKHGPLGPVAMVASEIEQYGLGRTFEILPDNFTFAVFRTSEEAQTWLDRACDTREIPAHRDASSS